MKFFSPFWRCGKGGNFNFCNINSYLLTLLLELTRETMTVFKVFRIRLKSCREVSHWKWFTKHAILTPEIKHFLHRFTSASHLSLDKAGQGWVQKAPPPRIWPKLQRWTTHGPTPRIHWQAPPKDPKRELCYCYTKPPKMMT